MIKKHKIAISVVGILIISAAVFGCVKNKTFAFLSQNTEQRQNDFSPKKYTDVEIEEPNGNSYIIGVDGKLDQEKKVTFNNPDKSNKNEYIRAKVVAIIRNEDGSNAGECPDLSIQYSLDYNWVEKNGYYYYTDVVIPGKGTSELFYDISVKQSTLDTLKPGQYIEVNVIADSIESTKVMEAWGLDPSKLS